MYAIVDTCRRLHSWEALQRIRECGMNSRCASFARCNRHVARLGRKVLHCCNRWHQRGCSRQEHVARCGIVAAPTFDALVATSSTRRSSSTACAGVGPERIPCGRDMYTMWHARRWSAMQKGGRGARSEGAAEPSPRDEPAAQELYAMGAGGGGVKCLEEGQQVLGGAERFRQPSRRQPCVALLLTAPSVAISCLFVCLVVCLFVCLSACSLVRFYLCVFVPQWLSLWLALLLSAVCRCSPIHSSAAQRPVRRRTRRVLRAGGRKGAPMCRCS